jgi:quinoprotein dehydrogenase-associated probable ABC transporter substrate-binding protein
MTDEPLRCLTLLLAACALSLVAAAQQGADAPADTSVLRVCADPDSLPQSNRRGEGYENKIAEQLARDLGRKLEYTFFPQRMGFVRNTLRRQDPQTRQYSCDVIIGVPKGYELTATTRPYMRSTYALVFPHRPELQQIETAADLLKLPPQMLQSLRIGVFGYSPGADWLARNGLLEQAVVYAPQSGDPAENPAHTVEQDMQAQRIDVAVVWGPVAGFLVSRHAGSWRAAPFTPDPQIKFDYELSMGVRFGEQEWKETLDRWISEHQQDVNEILASYHIPLLDADGQVSAGAGSSERLRAGAIDERIPLRLQSD